MPRDENSKPKAQEIIVQPLAINHDRFKDDEIPGAVVRNKLNNAWRALDGLSAVGRILEANHAEQTAQDEPLALDCRVVAGLLSAVVALAEIGRGEVDDCGEYIHAQGNGANHVR